MAYPLVANISYTPVEVKALPHERASGLVASFSSLCMQTREQISASLISDRYTVCDQAIQALRISSIPVIVHVVPEPQSQYTDCCLSA